MKIVSISIWPHSGTAYQTACVAHKSHYNLARALVALCRHMTCDLTPPPEKDMGKWRDCRLIATRSIQSSDRSCMFKPPFLTSFFLPVGAMTDMPAVRVFALYAGVAIVINFLLQIFAFTALLTLDAKRMEVSLLKSFRRSSFEQSIGSHRIHLPLLDALLPFHLAYQFPAISDHSQNKNIKRLLK